MIIDVFPLPERVPEGVVYDISFCIDVLRATTCFVTAKRYGAEIVPCLTVEEALEKKAAFVRACPNGRVLLGGERKGVLIEGFDLGNSPSEYATDQMRGKTIFFTTTNGTRAIRRGTGVIVPVCFLNVREQGKMVLEKAVGNPALRIAIICAGTDGYYTDEDLLLAGCLVERLSQGLHQMGQSRPECNGQAEIVRGRWQDFVAGLSPECMKEPEDNPEQIGNQAFCKQLFNRLRLSRGGKNLVSLNLTCDIAFAAGM